MEEIERATAKLLKLADEIGSTQLDTYVQDATDANALITQLLAITKDEVVAAQRAIMNAMSAFRKSLKQARGAHTTSSDNASSSGSLVAELPPLFQRFLSTYAAKPAAGFFELTTAVGEHPILTTVPDNSNEILDNTGFGGHVKWVVTQIKKGESSGGMTQFNPQCPRKG